MNEAIRPFQENKHPKYKRFSEEKVSGLEGFNFWNYLSNTSPLLYLYRIDAAAWLPKLFTEVWTPMAVVEKLQEGRRRGYNVPDPRDYDWLQVLDPHSVPIDC